MHIAARLRETLAARASERPRRGEAPADFQRRVPGAAFARRAWLPRGDEEDDASYEARLEASVARHLNVSPSLGITSPTVPGAGESEDDYRQRLWSEVAKRLGLVRRGETDAAWELRRNRAAMKQQQRAQGANPIREAGAEAINAIQVHALGMNATERNRAFPKPVSARSLQGRNINDPETLLLYSQRHLGSVRRGIA